MSADATQALLPVTLKPCPFCDGSATVSGWEWFSAECDDCGAKMAARYKSKSDAITSWNTRSQSHSLPGEDRLSDWRDTIIHPNNRLLFRRMAEVAGIDIGTDDIATALRKVAALTPSPKCVTCGCGPFETPSLTEGGNCISCDAAGEGQ